jgi:ATP-dependent Zn protease
MSDKRAMVRRLAGLIDRKAANGGQMESGTPGWVNMLISWFPFILLIAFWIFFMRRSGVFGRQAKYMDRSLAFMERQEQLLERIATALEERNKSAR